MQKLFHVSILLSLLMVQQTRSNPQNQGENNFTKQTVMNIQEGGKTVYSDYTATPRL